MERSKTLTVDDKILYIENPKDSTRKLLELINEYSKVAGYKINTQKSLAFLYTNNEKTEREIKETIAFTIVTKRIKYLGINLPKEVNCGVSESPFDSKEIQPVHPKRDQSWVFIGRTDVEAETPIHWPPHAKS